MKKYKSNYDKMIDRMKIQGKKKTLSHARYRKFAIQVNKGMEEFENDQRGRDKYTILHMNDFVMHSR